jgi:hypothetical protein
MEHGGIGGAPLDAPVAPAPLALPAAAPAAARDAGEADTTEARPAGDASAAGEGGAPPPVPPMGTEPAVDARAPCKLPSGGPERPPAAAAVAAAAAGARAAVGA